MGRAKQMLEEGMTFEEYLKDIIENIYDSTTEGIAKLAIDKGFDNLSEKQQFILKEGISDYIIEECPNCGIKINYEDMDETINNGRCYDCQNHWEKIEVE